MISRTGTFVLAALTLAHVAGCGGGDAPTVQVLSAIPTELDPARDDTDDLTLRVAYADADGDLGGGIAKIHDCRASGLMTELALPPIATDEAVEDGVSIEGELALVIPDVGAAEIKATPPKACRALGVGAPSADAQAFCVVLVDAAGNAGEGDCTEPIHVLPATP